MKLQGNYKIKIYIGILLSVTTGISGCEKLYADNSALPLTEEWEVIKVSDGDTITIRQTNGQEKKVRLCGIDAPEKAQPLGKESKANLQKLVDEANKTVMVAPIETDRYGRLVAEVFTAKNGGEKLLNEEQISSGMAYEYTQYSGKCPNKIALTNAEAIAKSKRLGVWGGNYQKPWEYRKARRSN